MSLKVALIAQSNEISDLVNSAYRGHVGWTKETEIVSGARISTSEIESIIQSPHRHLLVAFQNNQIASCICLEKDQEQIHISLFSVLPTLQGSGIGNNILLQAEQYASSALNANKLVIIVISQRIELISYYERRGYVKTGRIEGYPDNENSGAPKLSGLTVEYLEKLLSRH